MDPTEPTDEQKLAIMRSLQAHLGKLCAKHTIKPPKALLGEYPVPAEHIERVLALAGAPSSRKATNELWRCIYSLMPATVDYRCSLNTQNATRPTVQLREYAPGSYIQVGVKGVLERHVLPAESYSDVEQLTYLDDDTSTALTRFKLWSRIEQLLPPIANTYQNEWKLYVGAQEIIVFRCDDSQTDDEDEPADDDNDN